MGRVGAVPPEFWQNPGGVGVDVASGLDVMPETPHRSAVDSKVHRVGTVPPEFWQNPGGVAVDEASGGTVPPEFWLFWPAIVGATVHGRRTLREREHSR